MVELLGAIRFSERTTQLRRTSSAEARRILAAGSLPRALAYGGPVFPEDSLDGFLWVTVIQHQLHQLDDLFWSGEPVPSHVSPFILGPSQAGFYPASYVSPLRP